MTNLLDDLFFKYRADKTPRIKHHYSGVYYELFKDRRETVKKVLEIGTAEGASLYAWRDFFPNATIYGMEIDQRRVDKLQGLERIEVFQGDQSTYQLFNVEETSAAGYGFDVIIDDGSHKPADQLFSALMLAPKLPIGSYYIIEDVDDENALFGELEARLSKYSFNWHIQKKRVGTRHDDCLIIFKKT